MSKVQWKQKQDTIKVLYPTRNKIDNIGDVLPSQSLGLLLKNWNKHTKNLTRIHNKMYYNIKLTQKNY